MPAHYNLKIQRDRDEIAQLIKLQRQGIRLGMYPVSGAVSTLEELEEDQEEWYRLNFEEVGDELESMYRQRPSDENIEEEIELRNYEVGDGCEVKWDYIQQDWVTV